MPFASKAQQRLFYALAARGEISKKTLGEYTRATRRKKGGFKALPERLSMQRRNMNRARRRRNRRRR